MTTQDIYSLIAAEVAKGDLSELYMIASRGFGFMHASQEVHQIAAQIQEEMHEDAHVVLAQHFHICNAVTNDVLFSDECGGVIDVDGIAVAFQVKQIGDNPKTFRVLFSRVKAAKLLTDVNQKIEDLAERVHRLELADSK